MTVKLSALSKQPDGQLFLLGVLACLRIRLQPLLYCALRLRYVFIRAGSQIVSCWLVAPFERFDKHGIDLLVESSDDRHEPKALLSYDRRLPKLSLGTIV